MKGVRFDALVFGQVATSILENEQGAFAQGCGYQRQRVTPSDCHASRSLGSLSNASQHVWRVTLAASFVITVTTHGASVSSR